MNCPPGPKMSLPAQLRAKRQDELFAEMQVRLDIASLKRSLEKRRRIQEEIQLILEKMAGKDEKSEESEEK